MSTPIIGDIIDHGKTITTELGTWIKDMISFIFGNFSFDNPFHLFALSLIFLLMNVILLGLFGGSGIGLNGYSGISVGSGSVMAGTGSMGDLFTGASPGEASGDSDGDGIPDNNDGDMDGDGIPNSEDFDVDGDEIPNENDPTPCGDYLRDCNMPTPMLCGNGLCDNFKTGSEHTYLDYFYPSFCSDKNMFYDIPAYCFGDGTLGDTKTVANSTFGDVTYYNSVCGITNLQSRLSIRCHLYNNSIYYVENSENCPIDCNSTEYSCYQDFTCDLFNYCADKSLYCCPSGTLWAGHCIDVPIDQGFCNDQSGAGIVGAGIPINQLRNIPYHCDCSNTPDCVSDWGGSSCCPSGTYHVGFCYDYALCNVTI